MPDLADYRAVSNPSGPSRSRLCTDDTGRILDAVMQDHPLGYGRYQRNAGISAPDKETAQPGPGSTTHTHVDGFEPGSTETYPMVELKISPERDLDMLARVMEAVIAVHH